MEYDSNDRFDVQRNGDSEPKPTSMEASEKALAEFLVKTPKDNNGVDRHEFHRLPRTALREADRAEGGKDDPVAGQLTRVSTDARSARICGSLGVSDRTVVGSNS